MSATVEIDSVYDDAPAEGCQTNGELGEKPIAPFTGKMSVGAGGGVRIVAIVNVKGAEGTPSPAAFDADTLQKYCVPGFNPNENTVSVMFD